MSDAVLPDFGGRCVNDLVPAILEPGRGPSVLPDEVVDARSVILFVIDGLGWHQLAKRWPLAPTMASFDSQYITTVAPSTTAVALTSITTGMTPGEHGIIGYRVAERGDLLNVLRWGGRDGDARRSIVPEVFQPAEAFLGQRPAVVTKSQFESSGFTRAHLAGGRLFGWRNPSGLPVEAAALAKAGEPFVYVYYDGLDRVAHEFGLGHHYDAELAFCDYLVAKLIDQLPHNTALVITADHGHVDCRNGERALASTVRALTDAQSGEARFRWLHTGAPRRADLLDACLENHESEAWVVSVEQTLDEGWFGPSLTADARRRLGDVALVAKDNWAFIDPADLGSKSLISRHGSLTPDEMHVPVLSVVL